MNVDIHALPATELVSVALTRGAQANELDDHEVDFLVALADALLALPLTKHIKTEADRAITEANQKGIAALRAALVEARSLAGAERAMTIAAGVRAYDRSMNELRAEIAERVAALTGLSLDEVKAQMRNTSPSS